MVGMAEAAAGRNPFGLSTERPVLNLARTAGVSGLLKRAGVKSINGWARFRDGKTVEVGPETGLQIVRAEAVVIATGSVPIELPSLPFGDPVISSTDALALTDRADRLVVVGAGYIGLELGTAFAKLGTTVTVVEAQPRILCRTMMPSLPAPSSAGWSHWASGRTPALGEAADRRRRGADS
jgi:dihydrolipoamide dehydrogenase